MIRPARPDELNYVYATWVMGIVRGAASTMPRVGMRRTVELLLSSAKVIVDVKPAEPTDTILGWCCYSPLLSTSVVHYIYVRTAYRGSSIRRRGIARDLAAAAGVDLARPIPYTVESVGRRSAAELAGNGVVLVGLSLGDVSATPRVPEL